MWCTNCEITTGAFYSDLVLAFQLFKDHTHSVGFGFEKHDFCSDSYHIIIGKRRLLSGRALKHLDIQTRWRFHSLFVQSFINASRSLTLQCFGLADVRSLKSLLLLSHKNVHSYGFPFFHLTPTLCQSQVIKMLQSEVCTQLGLWKSSCDQMVYDYIPEILEIIASSVVCLFVRVCVGGCERILCGIR